MSKNNVALELAPRQDFQENWLSSEDRHLLLGASLQILARRFVFGVPILKCDVLRVASLADDGSAPTA